MKFVRNLWYPGAWANEVKPDTLLYRKIINEPVLLTRNGDGTAVAMSNVCPHRFAPLHLGSKKGDRIQCPYHGLEYDARGACVHNPNTPGTIPPGMKVPTYPVIERYRMLWVWMGDRAPDETLIPDFSVMEADDGLYRYTDHFKMNVNVELLSNNLMDLSHGAFLHAGLIGMPEHADADIKVTQDGYTVRCDRFSRNVPNPMMFDLMFRRDQKNVDFWNSMRWDPPCCFLLDVGCHPPGGTRDEGTGFLGVHILCPETERSTHYFVGMVRKPIREEDREFEEKIKELRLYAFKQQDEPLMEAMQDMLGLEACLARSPVLFNVDAGPVRIKRVLTELLEKDARGNDQ